MLQTERDTRPQSVFATSEGSRHKQEGVCGLAAISGLVPQKVVGTGREVEGHMADGARLQERRGYAR